MPRLLESRINGLIVVELDVHGDDRGSFTEKYNRQVMLDFGMPEDFIPVQQNESRNKGLVTRGIHAEPWKKYISPTLGKFFAAFVDMRPDSQTFGEVETHLLDPSMAVFLPEGVGNSYQTTAAELSIYSYLVDQHWSAEAKAGYSFVNLADPELGIEWPTPLDQTTLSQDDKDHPGFTEYRRSLGME